METKKTSQPKLLLPARLVVALFSMLCTFGIARASTEVQVPVDNDADMCSHFRKALIADHVAVMTRGQLCQYNFTQRHAAQGKGYFQRLNWQPVAGDPVSLTMKISNANYPTSLAPVNKASDSARRAEVQSYAKIQNRHHALTIETAPFSATQATAQGKIIRIDGYLLSSRGSYCGKNDKGGLNKRRQLLAFYTDKALTKNLPDATFGGREDSEPLEINGQDYEVYINDESMWGTLPRSGIIGMYTISMGRLVAISDGDEVADAVVCAFTYTKRAPTHGK